MLKTRSSPVQFVIVLCLAFVQHAIADPNSTDSNGLYYVSSSPTGETVKGGDGSTVNLGAKADIQILHARVYSLNNANTDFEVRLETSEYPVDAKTGLPIKPVVLRVGDRAWSSTGWAGTKGSYNMILFNIHGLEEAKTAAKSLSVDCALRSPPGYKLLAQFIPVQPEFHTNQPVLVKFVIKNLDDRTIVFPRGGMQRGYRDNQYGFRAIVYGHPVLDTGNPLNFGGLSVAVRLEPGKEFEDQVDLKNWFSFDKTGTYLIHGFYRMAFYSSEDPSESMMPWDPLWEDYVSDDFQVVIK